MYINHDTFHDMIDEQMTALQYHYHHSPDDYPVQKSSKS